MTNQQAMIAAKQLAERQRHYDRLHDLKRLAWLAEEAPQYADGSRVRAFDVAEMTFASERSLLGYGSRAVDLSDAVYLAELDAYEATGKGSAGAHEIGYAYPTSELAASMGRSASGCYFYRQFGQKPEPCDCLSAARDVAARRNTSPGRWSFDHPLNAHMRPPIR